MLRFLKYIFAGLMTSLFLFPFNLPYQGLEVNTKMMLAAVGVVLFMIDKTKKKVLSIPKDFLLYSLLCIIISIWAFSVTVYNHTSDYAFAKYIISVWVWLSAGYAVLRLIQMVHCKISVELISNYMIIVCVVQCILAYLMTLWPSLGTFVDSLMGEGDAFMSATKNRMHGLGAALDPAGLRFSAVLIITSWLLAHTDFDTAPRTGYLYLVAFIIIMIIGNIIARSTTIGALVSICLLLISKWPVDGNISIGRSWTIVGGILLFTIALSVWLYRVNPDFRANLRFGFEGFFSLVEKGRWEVHSNEILKGMVVWPESLKTWIIGDGWFDNPQDIPDRFGRVLSGFYMQTDIGYLRYIFYFGTIGLFGMISVFVYMTCTCIKSFPRYKWMFLTLLLVNLIGWFKVSSDIIMVFAPFLVLSFWELEKDYNAYPL